MHEITKVGLAVAAAAMFVSTTFGDETPPEAKPVEIRQHWAAVRADGTSAYDVTQVKTVSEPLERSVYLIRESSGRRWRFEYSTDFVRHASMQEVREVASNTFVRISWKAEFPGKTRSEMLADFHGHGSNPKNGDLAITLETPQTKVTALESEWNDRQRSDDWRSEIRSALPASFTDALERMRDTLLPHDTGFDMVRIDLLTKVTYPAACEGSAPYTKKLDLDPDCGFDKDMGLPCSETQIQRIVSAAKDGRKLTRY